MFNEDFDDTDTDLDTGDLALEQIDQLGQHPDLTAISEKFARTINGLDWSTRKVLDELIGEAMLRGLEVGHAAGRFGASVAMRF